MPSIGTGVRLLESSPGTTSVVDVSCGACSACRAGSALWCETPRDDGAVLAIAAAARACESLSALLLADAVRCADLDGDEVVLVLGGEEAVAAGALVGSFHAGPVLVGADPRDGGLQERLLSLRPSGRADVVASAGSDRDAVRSVVRGGDVCLVCDGPLTTTVTELVQREVRLVGPRDPARLLEAVGGTAVDAALGLI